MTSMTFTIPILETQRLSLRAPVESDFEHEVDFFASERSHFVGGPIEPEQVWRAIAGFLGHWAMRGYGFWGIDEKSTGTYLGRVGLWCPEGWPEREIGWTLMNGAEGKGYAHEAALAARQYAYDVLGWNTAITMILAGNDRSIRLAEKLGASHESDFEHDRFGQCHIYRHPSPDELDADGSPEAYA